MTLHAELVARVVKHGSGVTRRAFAASVQKAADLDIEDARGPLSWVVPDAFKIDAENRVLTVYEVEVTSRLTSKKLASYAAIWWLLDYSEWTLEVVVVDRYGVFRKIAMQVYAYATMYPSGIPEKNPSRLLIECDCAEASSKLHQNCTNSGEGWKG